MLAQAKGECWEQGLPSKGGWERVLRVPSSVTVS